ncbi:hypothetical protein EON80_14105, partial [bacterium]
RYEVVVWDREVEIFRGQTDKTFLPFNQKLRASKQYSWQVIPLQKENDEWIPDGVASDAATFEVASTAVVQELRSDLNTLSKETQTLDASLKTLSRAAFYTDTGFYQAGLDELDKIQNVPEAWSLRDWIWRATGQKWRFAKAQTVTTKPIGNADRRYLALAVKGPVNTDRRKTYVTPGQTFSIQIPTSFCAYQGMTDGGAVYTDLSAGVDAGARITMLYGPVSKFADSNALIRHLQRWQTDGIAKLPGMKGSRFTFEPLKPTTFRGSKATQMDFLLTTKGQQMRGQVIAWRVRDFVFLFTYSAGTGDLADARAMRPLLDTAKFGNQVTGLPNKLTGVQTFQKILDDKQAGYQRQKEDGQRMEQEQKEDGAEIVATAENLAKLEKALLVAPVNSFERGGVARLASRLAAVLAGNNLDKNNSAEANHLMARSIELSDLSYRSNLAAFQARVANNQKIMARWSQITPTQLVLNEYLDLMVWLRDERAQLLTAMFSLIRGNRPGDLDERERISRLVFETWRAEWQDRILARSSDIKNFEKQAEIADSLEKLGTSSARRADVDGARAYFARAMEWRRAIPASYANRNLFEAYKAQAKLELGLGDVRLARDYFGMAQADFLAAQPAHARQIGLEKDETVRGYRVVLWKLAQADVCNSQGSIYRTLGQYDKSEEEFQKALKLLDPEPGQEFAAAALNKVRAAVFNNLQVLRESAGDVEGADQMLAEATRLFRQSGDQRSLAGTLYAAAAKSYRQNDAVNALRQLDEALNIYRLLESTEDIADCELFKAQIYNWQGQFEQAIANSTSALERAFQLDDPERIIRAGTRLARSRMEVLYIQGFGSYLAPPPPASVSIIGELVAEVEKADQRFGGASENVTTLLLRSSFASFQGKHEEALELQMAAIARSERIRTTSKTQDTFNDEYSNAKMYERAVDMLIRLNRPDEAFDILSRARSKVVRDNLSFSAMRSADPELQRLLDRAIALEDRLTRTRSQLTEAVATQGAERDPERIKNLEQLVASLERWPLHFRGHPRFAEDLPSWRDEDQFEPVYSLLSDGH